eukprot:GILK01002071.1.p1 GENE.GILK01002071.1~~GILK01002071.1.p1  ORF type:complete len:526 (+),score=96.13 GILK01002071.1:79-1578(+)
MADVQRSQPVLVLFVLFMLCSASRGQVMAGPMGFGIGGPGPPFMGALPHPSSAATSSFMRLPPPAPFMFHPAAVTQHAMMAHAMSPVPVSAPFPMSAVGMPVPMFHPAAQVGMLGGMIPSMPAAMGLAGAMGMGSMNMRGMQLGGGPMGNTRPKRVYHGTQTQAQTQIAGGINGMAGLGPMGFMGQAFMRGIPPAMAMGVHPGFPPFSIPLRPFVKAPFFPFGPAGQQMLSQKPLMFMNNAPYTMLAPGMMMHHRPMPHVRGPMSGRFHPMGMPMGPPMMAVGHGMENRYSVTRPGYNARVPGSPHLMQANHGFYVPSQAGDETLSKTQEAIAKAEQARIAAESEHEAAAAMMRQAKEIKAQAKAFEMEKEKLEKALKQSEKELKKTQELEARTRAEAERKAREALKEEAEAEAGNKKAVTEASVAEKERLDAEKMLLENEKQLRTLTEKLRQTEVTKRHMDEQIAHLHAVASEIRSPLFVPDNEARPETPSGNGFRRR